MVRVINGITSVSTRRLARAGLVGALQVARAAHAGFNLSVRPDETDDMICTSMLDVVRTGTLGPIRLGLTRDELREHLSEPADWIADEGKDRASIWRYGNIEFHFHRQALSLIFCDQEDLFYGGSTLKIDPWIVRYGQPRYQVERALSEMRIGYTQIRPEFDPAQRCILLESGVQLLLIDEPADDWSQSGLFAWSTDHLA